MENGTTFLLVYGFLQLIIIYKSWRLMTWNNKRFGANRRRKGPKALRNFCIIWMITAFIVMFLDVGLLRSAVQLAMNAEWLRVLNASPIFAVILLTTFTKTQFIQMCWIVATDKHIQIHLSKIDE